MGKKKKAAELAAREAALAAELERRKAEKAAAKKGKKGKKAKAEKPAPEPKKKAKAPKVIDIPTDTETGDAPARHPHLDYLDRIGELARTVEDPSAKKKAKAAAAAELKRLRDENEARTPAVDDEALKAKLAAKRAAREALSPTKAARHEDAREGESEVEFQQRRLSEKVAAGADEGEIIAAAADAVSAVSAVVADVEGEIAARIGQTVEAVETEEGRVFEAGAAAEGDEFAKPSEAEPVLEEGRNGYKIIALDKEGRPDPKKVRQFTRATTFVKNIDDETNLKKWEKRLLAEGLAADTIAADSLELFAKVNEIAHRREVKVAKAIKADRKGKLGVGDLGQIIAAAHKEAKTALDEIVEEALALAGRSDKADLGSHLHTLTEIADDKGIDAVRALHESNELVETKGKLAPVTATDLASIEAYVAGMARLGAKVVEAEAVVVNDELGYAGRLDRIIAAKLPEITFYPGKPTEWTRPADNNARRYVLDVKTGSLEYSGGQIARQLAAYAAAKLYDMETGERTAHRASRDVAIVAHLPVGEGAAHFRVVDLKAGAAMLKLSAEVRRARNTGKAAIDLKTDLAEVAS